MLSILNRKALDGTSPKDTPLPPPPEKFNLDASYFFIHIILPILGGTTIYALFRGIYFIDSQQNNFPLLLSSDLPEWVKYNLPDGLWLYSFLSSIIFIWKNKISQGFFVWIFSIIALSVLSEFFQIHNFIPGTFDLKDLLAYFIATTLCIFHFPYITKS